MTISIVLPCFNERQIIGRTIESVVQWARLGGHAIQIVVVDDGSTDGSWESIGESFRLLGITDAVSLRHESNKGYSAAVRDGLDHSSGEILGFMDSDGQFDPQDFDALIRALQRADVVTGVRQHRADPWPRKMNAALYRMALRLVFGVRASDIDCGMKLIRREKWPIIRPSLVSGALFNGEMFVRMLHAGIPYAEVPVRHLPRTTGKATGAKPTVILRAVWEMLRLIAAFPGMVLRIRR